MSNDLFTKSNGEATTVSTSCDASSRVIIPDGTQLLCHTLGAKWNPADQYSNKHLEIGLMVTQAGEFKGMTQKHKLHVFDSKETKADKAKDMLAVYDTLSGGKIKALGDKAMVDGQINKAIAGIELVVTFGLIESTYTNRDGVEVESKNNWVRAIQQKPKNLRDEDEHIERQAAFVDTKTDVFSSDDYFDESIPF